MSRLYQVKKLNLGNLCVIARVREAIQELLGRYAQPTTDLKNLVENSEYSYKKPVDSKHAHKNNGQEIYHNAFIYDGKPYEIEISIDIPKGGKSPYPYAGHKIKIIEMAPTDNVTNFLKGNVRDQVSAENIVPLPTYKSLSDWQSLENLLGQGGKNTLNNIIIDNAEIFKPSKVKTSQRGGLEPLNKYLGEDAKENLFYNIDDIVERPLSDYSPSQVAPNHIITNFAEISTPCPSS